MSQDASTVDSLIPARKIQALVALGWSYPKLATYLGVKPERVGELARRLYRRVTVDTDSRVDALFRRLCMTPPDSSTRWDSFAITRAKQTAAAHGWVPPLAWDDIDNPDEDPQGTDFPRHEYADLDEFMYLIGAGEYPLRAAERLGVTIQAIERAALRHKRHDVARAARGASMSESREKAA